MRAQVASLVTFVALAACGPGTITTFSPAALGSDGGAADARAQGPCAQTCAGCCLEGVCFEGTFPQACGTGGSLCQICLPGPRARRARAPPAAIRATA